MMVAAVEWFDSTKTSCLPIYGEINPIYFGGTSSRSETIILTTQQITSTGGAKVEKIFFFFLAKLLARPE